MRIPLHLGAAGIVLVLALTLAGCKKHKGAEPEPPDTERNPLKPDPAGGAPARTHVQRGAQLQVLKNLMHNIGIYYQSYRTDNNDRAPRTLEEFKAYLQSIPDARTVAQAVDKGWLVFRMNPPPGANQVLAYEKDAFQLNNDRLVLFGGGQVELLTEDKFQAALQQ
jgi:hypothetical protein